MLLTVALVIVSLAVVAQPTANPVVEPPGMTAETAAVVDTALPMLLPSDGSTRGMFGRRDRCLLVLSQIGGVPYRQLAALTAGDIDVTDGAARSAEPAKLGWWRPVPTRPGAGCVRSPGGSGCWTWWSTSRAPGHCRRAEGGEAGDQPVAAPVSIDSAVG